MRDLGLPDLRDLGLPDLRDLGFADLPDLRTLGLADLRTLGFPDARRLALPPLRPRLTLLPAAHGQGMECVMGAHKKSLYKEKTSLAITIRLSVNMSCQSTEFVRFHRCMNDFLCNMIQLAQNNGDNRLSERFAEKLSLLNTAQDVGLNFTGVRFYQQLSGFESDIMEENPELFTKLATVKFEGLEDIDWIEVYNSHLAPLPNDADNAMCAARDENRTIVCQYLKTLYELSIKCVHSVNPTA